MTETTNISPKFEIGPGWSLSGDFPAGGSSETYYYYKPRPAVASVKDVTVKVDWKQRNINFNAISALIKSVLDEK